MNLGVAATSSGVLNYTGGGGTLDKNINAVGNGTDTVRNSGSGALTLSGTLTKNGTNLTLNAATAGINVTGNIVGAAANSDLIVTGNNTTSISSTANTYNGRTTVGTVAASTTILAVTGSLSGTTGVTVNSGGTLLLNSSAGPGVAGSNIIGTVVGTVGSASYTSNGGTLAVGTGTDHQTHTFASMTLNANSTLDFGSGSATNTLQFGSLFGAPGATTTALQGGSLQLSILNWNGTQYSIGDTTDNGSLTQARLLFNTDPGFGAGIINGINFSGFGAGAIQVSFGASQFEIVPVPEPATTALIGAVALCALIGYRERRRFTGVRSRLARK